MSQVKVKSLRIVNAILSALLAMLGFHSCIDPVVEYGTPSARFIVKGKIRSATTEMPVQNIRVIMNFDTVYSDENGNYNVNQVIGFPTDHTYNLSFCDIDQEMNGSYQELDTIVEFKNPVFTRGDGHWYAGETAREMDIQLKPEE